MQIQITCLSNKGKYFPNIVLDSVLFHSKSFGYCSFICGKNVVSWTQTISESEDAFNSYYDDSTFPVMIFGD